MGGNVCSKFWGGGGVGGVCSKFSGGGVCSKFSGGGGCLLQIFGGCLQFSEYGHCSAGTHPTGMHSCSQLILALKQHIYSNKYNILSGNLSVHCEPF